jgi:hypothetical protein
MILLKYNIINRSQTVWQGLMFAQLKRDVVKTLVPK